MEHFNDSEFRVGVFISMEAVRFLDGNGNFLHPPTAQIYNHENVFRCHKKDYTNMSEQISLIDSEFLLIVIPLQTTQSISRHISVLYVYNFGV